MSRFASLRRSKTLLLLLVAVVAVAVVGTTYTYAALAKSVTVSLDGQPREVTSYGDTVGDVLAAEGVEVGEHDVVAPGLDEEVSDGTQISVRFGRPLELTVDGAVSTHWVTSTRVAAALGQIGRRFSAADLSVSRSATIGRSGLALQVVTPKTVRVRIGDRPVVRDQVTALTVGDVLDELDVDLDKDDRVEPGLRAEVTDGARLVVTRIRVERVKVRDETIDFQTLEQADDSMYEGEESVAQEGVVGLRNVTYELRYKNGTLVRRREVAVTVTRRPVDAVVNVGTKEQPPAQPSANYASGSSVWDSIAACESGGNWAINTGNGYYGGLQFNLSTWQAYGGAGYPHQQSREYQISIAERVRAATGGYGSWPACSASLGLPQ